MSVFRTGKLGVFVALVFLSLMLAGCGGGSSASPSDNGDDTTVPSSGLDTTWKVDGEDVTCEEITGVTDCAGGEGSLQSLFDEYGLNLDSFIFDSENLGILSNESAYSNQDVAYVGFYACALAANKSDVGELTSRLIANGVVPDDTLSSDLQPVWDAAGSTLCPELFQGGGSLGPDYELP
jgi:hypothetical protein